MKFKGQSHYNHSHDQDQNHDHDQGKIKQGILISNLGTPDAPTAKALRVYLKEFLSDGRVVEIPRFIWWCILNLIILNLRPRRSAKLYQRVWTDQGSPLMSISVAQRDALQQRLNKRYGDNQVPVVLAMRYGNPSIASALQQLQDQNVRKITVLPLYPQYCAATTASTFDAITSQLQQYRWVPEFHFISGYHKNPAYINALANSIRNYLSDLAIEERPDLFIFSYHGIPLRNLKMGDPYYCFCMQTTRLVLEALSWQSEQILTTFQSRFGKATWLQPYTEASLQALPDKGVNKVALLCPGFSADCLETLDEIAREAQECFISAGGQRLDYIPCLNADTNHIDVMLDVLAPYLP